MYILKDDPSMVNTMLVDKGYGSATRFMAELTGSIDDPHNCYKDEMGSKIHGILFNFYSNKKVAESPEGKSSFQKIINYKFKSSWWEKFSITKLPIPLPNFLIEMINKQYPSIFLGPIKEGDFKECKRRYEILMDQKKKEKFIDYKNNKKEPFIDYKKNKIDINNDYKMNIKNTDVIKYIDKNKYDVKQNLYYPHYQSNTTYSYKSKDLFHDNIFHYDLPSYFNKTDTLDILSNFNLGVLNESVINEFQNILNYNPYLNKVNY
jgi:hypothetical protein